jgi:hypothetical protein
MVIVSSGVASFVQKSKTFKLVVMGLSVVMIVVVVIAVVVGVQLTA